MFRVQILLWRSIFMTCLKEARIWFKYFKKFLMEDQFYIDGFDFWKGVGGFFPPFSNVKIFCSHVYFWIYFSSFYSFMWFRFASDWVVFAFLSSRLTVSYCWLPFTQPKVYFVVWLNQLIVINCCFKPW